MNVCSLMREKCFIDSKWCDGDNGGTIDVSDPGKGTVLGTVPNMGQAETERAINAAEAALPAWRATTAGDRAKIIRKFFDLMIVNQDGRST